ncbi:SWIM-type domain-containing protein [Raphanus sativus]|nr:SWIM-type domain-containing protein [Raphanus sativus]
MAEHCMVIAGQWETSAQNQWNFLIDKEQMTRIVPLGNGITLTDLLSNIFKEFFDDPLSLRTAVLSYWPPNSKELATGLTTPPVMLTNDGAVSFFYHQFLKNKGLNLFVTFKPINAPVPADQSHLPFTTPNQPIKRTLSPNSSFSAKHLPHARSNSPQTNCPRVQHQSCPPIQRQTCTNAKAPSCPGVQPIRSTQPSLAEQEGSDQPFPKAGSSCPVKTSRISLIDETLLHSDELLENMFKEDPDNIPDSWVSEDEGETASDASLLMILMRFQPVV